MANASREFPKGSGIRIRLIVNKKKGVRIRTADGETRFIATSDPQKFEAPKKWRVIDRGDDSGFISFGDSWQVVVPPDVTQNGRLRKQFSTEAEAKDFAEKQHAGTNVLGARFVELSEDHMRDAVAAIDEIDKYFRTEKRKPDLTLVEAVAFALPRLRPPGGDKTIEQVVDEMVTSKKARRDKGNIRERSCRDFEVRAGRIKRELGAHLMKTLSADDIKGWIRGMRDANGLKLSQRSHANYMNVLAEILKHSEQKRYLTRNPLTDLTDQEREELCGGNDDEREPHILTIDQAKTLIETALDRQEELGLLPVVVLGLFCGIRTAELQGLMWQDLRIDWTDLQPDKEGKFQPEKSYVHISKKIAKKRRIRNVTIPRCALQWLALVPTAKEPARDGLLFTNRFSNDFQRRFQKLTKLAGFAVWPQNSMRHSFGSYHFHLHEDSLKTAAQMGHAANDSQLFDHYRKCCTKDEAQKYFGIVPPTPAENVIQMAATG
ncbi:MAG TPA: tyrosine-type recombinase/integrase [Verrucomicrobiae bacterium]|nr:tyrosine-type recombinase/integrase [Verrucomicrobiae bacterium]